MKKKRKKRERRPRARFALTQKAKPKSTVPPLSNCASVSELDVINDLDNSNTYAPVPSTTSPAVSPSSIGLSRGSVCRHAPLHSFPAPGPSSSYRHRGVTAYSSSLFAIASFPVPDAVASSFVALLP
jgi:hypothetical protein